MTGQNATSTDRSDWSADEWESYLEDHPDEVLMFVDGNFEIHTFEHDQSHDSLSFVRGGSHGYDYDGSRAALESFAKDDSDAHKLVPRDEEEDERRRLVEGEYETAKEWVQDV